MELLDEMTLCHTLLQPAIELESSHSPVPLVTTEPIGKVVLVEGIFYG